MEVVDLVRHRVGVRKVKPFVQLDPLDAPLLVVGQATVDPIRVSPEVQLGSSVEVTTATYRRSGPNVAVQRSGHGRG